MQNTGEPVRELQSDFGLSFEQAEIARSSSSSRSPSALSMDSPAFSVPCCIACINWIRRMEIIFCSLEGESIWGEPTCYRQEDAEEEGQETFFDDEELEKELQQQMLTAESDGDEELLDQSETSRSYCDMLALPVAAAAAAADSEHVAVSSLSAAFSQLPS